MPDDALDRQSKLTVQERGRGEVISAPLLLWLAAGTDLIPPWWSRSRDAALRRFWKQVDYLSGAVYTMESRLVTVPFRIQARDHSVKAHARQAEEFQTLLMEDSEFGQGWTAFYSKWVEDLVTADNGCFAEVIGEGKPDGPIEGRPAGLAQLDSGLCQRTSDPEFPVVYRDTSGRPYKLHHTRVIYSSQMPSPDARMHGMGFCAVSRCTNIAQNLLDIMVYKQEKLGSRPIRAMMVTKGGLDPDDVKKGFKLAEAEMDNQGLRRYARVPVIGSNNLPEADLSIIELGGLPDGFDEETCVTLGMATIALAFGVDPRELFPALTTGATRAEALISHIKQQGKGQGEILQTTENLFNAKFLPAQLQMVFDFQDDAQDRQVAEIKTIRAQRRVADLASGSLDSRTLREQMLEDGDLTPAQFARMELADGRLEDGSDVLSLFFSPDYHAFLDLGVSEPLDVEANDPPKILEAIREKRRMLLGNLAQSSIRDRQTIEQARAALDALELLYGGRSAALAQGKPATKPAEEATPDARQETTAREKPLGSEDLIVKGGGFKTSDQAIREAAEAVKAAADRMRSSSE